MARWGTQRGQKGFTLMEVLITCAILAVITAVAVPAYMGTRTKAGETSVVNDATGVATAVSLLMSNTATWNSGTITFGNGGTGTNAPVTVVADSATLSGNVNVSSGNVASGFMGANWWCIQIFRAATNSYAVATNQGTVFPRGYRCTAGGVSTNLVVNPTFAADTTGWYPRNGETLLRDTSVFYSSPASLRVTETATGYSGIGYNFPTNATLAPGTRYTVTAWVRVQDGQTISINAGGAMNCTSGGTTSTNWTQLSCTGTSPATPFQTFYILDNANPSTAGRVFWVDDVTFTAS